MFQQYHALKAANPDAILFFRMGDFYEMFFEDAEIAARELDLTLTARNKQDPDPVPMAGVPHHASKNYIERLVNAGYRVAIAEQVEDPRKAKGLVKRQVVRVVTPGVALDPTSLERRAPCWLVGVSGRGRQLGLAFLDASTGDFRSTTVTGLADAIAELQRMEPREALIAPDLKVDLAAGLRGAPVSGIEAAAWTVKEARREVVDVLGTDPRGLGSLTATRRSPQPAPSWPMHGSSWAMRCRTSTGCRSTPPIGSWSSTRPPAATWS